MTAISWDIWTQGGISFLFSFNTFYLCSLPSVASFIYRCSLRYVTSSFYRHSMRMLPLDAIWALAKKRPFWFFRSTITFLLEPRKARELCYYLNPLGQECTARTGSLTYCLTNRAFLLLTFVLTETLFLFFFMIIFLGLRSLPLCFSTDLRVTFVLHSVWFGVFYLPVTWS